MLYHHANTFYAQKTQTQQFNIVKWASIKFSKKLETNNFLNYNHRKGPVNNFKSLIKN